MNGLYPSTSNERHGDTPGMTEDKQLDGEDRSKRCLLHNPSTPQPPIVSEVHVGARVLSVYVPTIWPVLCSMDVHQGDEANSNLPMQYGSAHDSLHRQYTHDGESPNQAESHLQALMFLLTDLGFIINIPKSITRPTQSIEYLGLLVDSTFLQLSLPGEKLHHIRMEVNQIKQKSHVTACQLAQLIGKLNAASQAVLSALLFYQSLQGDLQRALKTTIRITILCCPYRCHLKKNCLGGKKN